jgi:hypothetical protein
MGFNHGNEKLKNVMSHILSYSTSLREIRIGLMAPPNVTNSSLKQGTTVPTKRMYYDVLEIDLNPQRTSGSDMYRQV